MKLLRQTIRQMILEGLRFEEDLMILNHPKTPGLYLLCTADYDPRYDLDKEKFYRQNVLAMINTKVPDDPCNNAREVSKAGAIEGYGPTLYDSVMELTNGIINDRSSVSNDAKRVMQRYKDTRPDVNKKLLDNIEDLDLYPMTADTDDDCRPGDMATFNGGVEVSSKDKGLFVDNPLSYSYNKELTPVVTNWKEKGDEFIKHFESRADLFYTDLRQWGSRMFEDSQL